MLLRRRSRLLEAPRGGTRQVHRARGWAFVRDRAERLVESHRAADEPARFESDADRLLADARFAYREGRRLDGPLPATLVRACAIHGPGAKLPRELFFVQRAHDGRRKVALASNGESRFHTTSVPNLAELVRLAAAQPGNRVLNSGDPDPPSTLEICNAIGAALGHEFEPVLFPEQSDERPGLDNPWAVPRPFVVSMAAAEDELGYRPVTTYPEAVRETSAWVVGELENGRSWDGTYLEGMLDYAAEDAAIASRE